MKHQNQKGDQKNMIIRKVNEFLYNRMDDWNRTVDSFTKKEIVSIKENTNTLLSKIKRNLTPDLLKGIWKNDDPKNYSGYCYVATEALWWMLGGRIANTHHMS